MRSLVFCRALWSCAAVILAAGAPVRAETTVTFTSKYEGTIKVCVYNATDVAQTIPLKSFEIDPNKSADWKEAPKTFHVKVFKPQLVDKLLSSRNQVPYNSSITLQKDNTIGVAKKSSLVFRNDSGKKLKFAVYKASDKSMNVPFKQWTIDSGKTVTWVEAPATFNLKLFEPQIIDKLVATKTGIADRKTVRATLKSGKYGVTVD